MLASKIAKSASATTGGARGAGVEVNVLMPISRFRDFAITRFRDFAITRFRDFAKRRRKPSKRVERRQKQSRSVETADVLQYVHAPRP